MDLFKLAISGDADAINDRQWTQNELNSQDENGYTALIHAAAMGNYRVIEALKAAGADIGVTDKDGLKAVHHAARHGYGVAIIYLIEGGCGG